MTNCPSSQIMLAMLRPLFYCQRLCVFDDFRFFVAYEWNTITDLWGCQTCEALGNEPLVWNMVSIMKWSLAKGNGCIWTVKLYLTVSTAVCCWTSRLLRAFLDQLLIHSIPNHCSLGYDLCVPCLWFNINKENNL